MMLNSTRYLIFLATLLISACEQDSLDPSPDVTLSQQPAKPIQASAEPIIPIPNSIDLNPQKIALGDALFHDKRLSHDNTISCASCHSLDTGGVDQKVHSRGIQGAEGGINAPTVFNSGFNFRLFWNGRAATLEEQVNGPTHHPKEMGSDWIEIVNKLSQDPSYVAKFSALYGDKITPEHIRDAIATFERSLYTPNSRFDRFLLGDLSALNQNEKAGYAIFKSYGCISCHQGTNVGGNMYQKFGVMADYFADRAQTTEADEGRFSITKEDKDLHVFRVPSLRNVELTYPYFHDGSAATLAEAVKVMGKYQLGRELSLQEINLLVQFLKTLTGEYQGKNLSTADGD